MNEVIGHVVPNGHLPHKWWRRRWIWATVTVGMIVAIVCAVARYQWLKNHEISADPAVSRPTAVASQPAARGAATTAPAVKVRRVEQKATQVAGSSKSVSRTVEQVQEEWRHWGASPYASSFDEACRKAPQAIDGTSMPAPVKMHFREVLGDHCANRKGELWLTPGQPLAEMWSGGKSPHVMKNVTVAELPVLVSPDGRPYRRGAVAEAARATYWEYAYEGKVYRLYLPKACFNWSWSESPVVATKQCLELKFNVPLGWKVRWGVGTVNGPLPPDECNAQRDGAVGSMTAWWGQCDDCVPALGFMRQLLGNEHAEVPHRYYYAPKQVEQTIRFSEAVKDAVVYVCLEDVDGRHTCSVNMDRRDWEKTSVHVITDDRWRFSNCSE